MKPILLLSLVGALAAPAAAGDVSFGFGFGHGKGGNRVTLAFGYQSNGHRHHDRVWVPGHYDTVVKKVWVTGSFQRVWQPARFGWRRDHCGHRVRVLLRPAGYVMVQTAGHWENVTERVWVPGRYVSC
jgi:hypothetical protein